MTNITPFYADPNVGNTTVDAPQIGLLPEGGGFNTHALLVATLPAVVGALLAWGCFLIPNFSVLKFLAIAVSVLLIIVSLLLVGTINTRMSDRASNSNADWFDVDSLGVSAEQRRELLMDITVVKDLRDKKLTAYTCGKLADIHTMASRIKNEPDAMHDEDRSAISTAIQDIADKVDSAMKGLPTYE